MNRLFPSSDQPGRRERAEDVSPPARDPSTVDNLLREVRRLLAGKSYDEVIAKLEIHRPAEWASVDASGARLLRLLSQAYLGKNNLAAARECLEHLWGLQNEKPFLSRDEFAAALSDLCKCYRGMQMTARAEECQAELRRLLYEK